MRNNIEKWRVDLEEASVEGIAEFIKKVRDNAKVSKNVDDFLCEAQAALMFREHGFSVKMQERECRPDLELGYSGIRFFAEVKHFRLKAKDEEDKEKLLEQGTSILKDCRNVATLYGPYGDTQATEGKPAWQQLVDVARSERKIKQYRNNFPNILVIFSSSPHCVEDADFVAAVHAINDDIASRKTPGLEKLSRVPGGGVKATAANRGPQSG